MISAERRDAKELPPVTRLPMAMREAEVGNGEQARLDAIGALKLAPTRLARVLAIHRQSG
jgi:hypothetical protein